jgi:protein involved in polysaccharide export with SLBB domain
MKMPVEMITQMRRCLATHGARLRAWVFAFFSASMLLAGCAPLPPMPHDEPAVYQLDAGDQIQVDVYGQTDLSGRYTLDDTGRVSLLKAGAVELRALSLRDAERRIAEHLKGELRNPEVAVNVVEYRPVYVMGQVVRGGKYPYAPGMTVLKAVALAGGYNDKASRSRIDVIRAGMPRARATEALLLQAGDTIDVGESLF